MIQLPYLREGKQIGTLYVESNEDIFYIKKSFKNTDLALRDLTWQVEDLQCQITNFYQSYDYVGMDTYRGEFSFTEMKIYLRKGKYIYSALKAPIDPPEAAKDKLPENVIDFSKRRPFTKNEPKDPNKPA